MTLICLFAGVTSEAYVTENKQKMKSEVDVDFELVGLLHKGPDGNV